MTSLTEVMTAMYDGMAALDEQRAKPGSDQDAALCEAEARVLTLAAKQLEDLLDADPGNVFVKQAFDSVMRPCFNAVTRLALFKRRDAKHAENGFAIRMEIDKVFHEMDLHEQAASAGDRAAMTVLRDLSLKAELFAEQGAIHFPTSLYGFEHLRTFSREMAEGWQEDLTDMERQ
ncbi:hypothetical protein [Caballeronia sp. LjRoot31]|uniref:hypothetical protein n=1 Tax=Caballeronia sp. LjRoot31 TaxID=3342324 RepID=UPI003ED095D0